MKRINLRLLLILIAVAAVATVGVFFLHRFQVARNAGSLAKLARLRLSEGKRDEAIGLFGRYIGFRPDDDEAFAEYARLVLDRAESPAAGRNDINRGYNVAEAAIRKMPDDDALRGRLAAFELRIGRFADAREHLQNLRSKADARPQKDTADPQADDPAADGADKTLDRTQINLLLARSWAGTGNYDEAAAIASELIGFDLAKKRFDPKRRAEAKTTDAFILLAAILEEKFKDIATADKVLEQLVKTNASDPQAWLGIARWHRQRGDIEAATRDLAKAEKLDPESVETLLAGFENAMDKKDLDKARVIVEKIATLHPDDERGVRAAVMLAMRQQDVGKAAELLEDAVAKMPGRPSLLLTQADVLFQANDIPGVERTIGKLREVFGKSSPAVGMIEARVLLAQQRWLQAKQKLDTVRPLVAGSDELTRQVDLFLAQCYEQLGEYDEQLEASRRVLSDDPNSLAARVGAASALIAAGRPDQALEEFERVAASIPADRLAGIPQVWGPLLQLRLNTQMKRPAAERDWSAIDGLLEMLQQSEGISSGQMSLLRADVLLRKGEFAAASDLLTAASKSDPRDTQVWSALATLTLRDKGPARALAVLQEAPQELANGADLLFVAAQIAAREPPEEASKRLFDIEKRALALPADQATRMLAALASLRLGLGQPEEAERLWSAVLEKSPDDLRVRTALYELAREQGNVDKARSRAEDLAKVAGPTSPQARVAQAGTRILEARKSMGKRLGESSPSVDTLTADEKRLLEEARNLLIEAQNDRPGWFHIEQLQSEIDVLRGDIPAAIDHLQRTVRMGPASPAVVRQLASLLYASNRLEEAQQAVALLGPDGLEGMERISAEMEMRSGRFDEAVAIAERAVDRGSKNPRDLLWLGQLLSRSGKADRAEDVLEQATEAAPELPQTWFALFSHQVATGRRKMAERTLEKAAAALESPDRQLLSAQGNEMLGRLDDAERDYRDALTVKPDDLSPARGLATFLIRRGRLKPAREELRRIIDAEADDAAAKGTKAWARRALAQLTADGGGYRALDQALALVDQNVGSDGKLGPEDVLVQVALLAGRPEPASWRRAIALLGSLSRSQSLSAEQRLQLAQLHEKSGNWTDCRNELLTLAAAANASPAILSLLAERLLEHGEIASAKAWITKLRSIAPEAPPTLALEAKLAIAEKDRPTAVAAAKKLMPSSTATPQQAGQLAAVAKLMEDLGFPKAADKALADFAGVSPDGVVARAEFLGRQKRFDEALDLLENSWKQLPLERILQSGITVVRGQGQKPAVELTDRLEGWFVKALREDPDSLVLTLLQSELRELQGRSGEVESIYRGLLARKDLTPIQAAIVSNNLAYSLARPEAAAEAKKLIDAAILELGPQPDLLDTRGVVLLAAGENRRAIEALQEAIQIGRAHV